jgi:hypothetical protein
MPQSGITPAKPGSAQAKLARRARNVENFQFLICHGMVKNSEVKVLPLIPVCNDSGAERCRFFRVPVQNARLAAGFARQTALRAVDSPAANRQTRGTWKILTS